MTVHSRWMGMTGLRDPQEYHNREIPGHAHALPDADVLCLTDNRLRSRVC